MRIIGVGSPFGADRFGWQVIENLNQQGLPAGIELITLDRPGVALIDYFDVDDVIIVDAIVSEDSPGKFYQLDASEINQREKAFSTHETGLAEAVSLAKVLNTLPKYLKIVGVNIGNEQNVSSEWIEKTCYTIKNAIIPTFLPVNNRPVAMQE